MSTTAAEMHRDLINQLSGYRISDSGSAALLEWCRGTCRNGMSRADFRDTPSGGRYWRLLLTTLARQPIWDCLNAGELDAEGVSMLEDIMFSGTRYCSEPPAS